MGEGTHPPTILISGLRGIAETSVAKWKGWAALFPWPLPAFFSKLTCFPAGRLLHSTHLVPPRISWLPWAYFLTFCSLKSTTPLTQNVGSSPSGHWPTHSPRGYHPGLFLKVLENQQQ